ncbi:hypothetical protein [uncultured Marinobacter sp.]|uniref:hypothetical protein n=1 Tax=uncultured Marinobacter sp. TaxID=187379 RepID=UPI0030D85BD0|tara:strand:+ start:5756 stop:6076 length:321 start_codon:yes stop_codon:yes gene_type:complete
MRKKLFVNDNTMELLRDLASNGYSFTEACKILRRNPWHVRDTAEDKGRFDELKAAFPRLKSYKERRVPLEPEGPNMRQLNSHQVKTPLHIPAGPVTDWLVKSWRVS